MTDGAARRADLKRAWQMHGYAAVVAAAGTLLLFGVGAIVSAT